MALAKLTIWQWQAQRDSLSLTNMYNNSKFLSQVNGSLLGKDSRSEWSLCVLRPVVPQMLVSSLDNICLLHLCHPKASLLLLLKQKQIIAYVKPWVMKKHLLLIVLSPKKIYHFKIHDLSHIFKALSCITFAATNALELSKRFISLKAPTLN